jgi:hypothetical protein
LEAQKASCKVSNYSIQLDDQADRSNIRSPTPQGDEYLRYIRIPPHNDFEDVRKWWLESTQQRDFPNLSKMALDVLSIPAMSAAPERLFSSSNITISDRRNRINIDTVEAIECIKSWRKLKSFNTEQWQEG